METSNSGENASKAFARERVRAATRGRQEGAPYAGKTCAREREDCERGSEKRTR